MIEAVPSLKTGIKLPETLSDFNPRAFRGDSPGRADIVEGRLPRGKLVILAGEGDVGKSWLLLDLFCAINDGMTNQAFGGRVVAKAPCVFLSGEDDFRTLDLRLKAIRQPFQTEPAEHGAIVPAPDIGVMHLVRRDYDNTVKTTDVFAWLDGQLQVQRDAFGDLGFVVIDTFSTFLPINANSPEETQAAYAALTHLAAKHDVCVIVTHHISKGAEQGSRASVRGSTAVVDGARAAYTLFRPPADEAARVVDQTGIDGEVVRLQIVKNNLGLSRTPVTFVRQADGRLVDVSDLLALSQAAPEQALVQVLAQFQAQGVRVTRTGRAGVHALRDASWPGGLGVLSRDKLDDVVRKALAQGLVHVADGVLVPA